MIHFQVSIEKGTRRSWLYSGCPGNYHASCPENCVGNWKVWVENSWKEDSTLAVTKSSEKR